MSDWGMRLDEALKLRGHQKSLAVAHALGVSESTISRWRKGQSISIEHAIQLCNFLNVSMDWLFLGQQFGDDRYPDPETRITIEMLRLVQQHPPRVGNALITLLESLSDRTNR